MSILFFVALFSGFLFSSFSLTIRLERINRAVLYAPISLFEISIPTVNVDENNLYFDKKKLERNVLTYFENNISDLCDSYEVDFYYYDQNDGSLCIGNECNAVEVTLTCTYSFFIDYSRTMKYEIHRGARYGQ